MAEIPIPIPERLKDRPVWEGKAIPFTTHINQDGQPDFKVIDAEIQWLHTNLFHDCGDYDAIDSTE